MASAIARIRFMFLSFPLWAADIFAEVAAKLQIKFHVESAGDWVGAIGCDFLEANLAIHRDRVFHPRFDGVEADVLIADLAGLSDDLVCESAAQSFATKLRTQIEALHLANLRFERVQGDAACELVFVGGEQKPTFGRSVVSGETGQFFVEVLKAKAEAEGLRVLEEEFAGLDDLCCGLDLLNGKTFNHRGHGGHRGSWWNSSFGFHFLCDLGALCG